MFRRRRHDDDFSGDDFPGDEEAYADEEVLEPEPAPAAAPQGPWDEADAPDDGVTRLDLGSLRVPVREGIEVRVDIDQQNQQAVAVTLASATSAMQVTAFAAPKSGGIWEDVRAEIAASLQTSGGSAQDVEGPYGIELAARVPTDQKGQLVPARFVGVDGPRWFLRGMLQGRAAVDRDADPQLLEAFGQVVVVRGGDAMVVRDGLPITLPKEALEQAAAEAERQGITLPERGPEITETR